MRDEEERGRRGENGLDPIQNIRLEAVSYTELLSGGEERKMSARVGRKQGKEGGGGS